MGRHQQRLFALCTKFGFTDTERHDLALILVNHEGSWRTMSERDALKLCDILQGYAYIQHVLRERSRIVRADIARPTPAMPPMARRRAHA